MTDQQGNAGGQAGQAGQPPQDPHQPPGQWGPPQQGQWGSPPPPPGQPGQQWQPSNPVPPAPQKSWFARHKILTTVLALVVLLLFVGLAGGRGGVESTAAEDATVTSGEGSGGFSGERTGPGQGAGVSQDEGSGNGGTETKQDFGSTQANSQDPPEPKQQNPDEGVLRVTVQSTGSTSGSVTFMQPDGSMQLSQNTSASYPWTKTWQDVDSLPMGWNMNAQQNSGGTITCTVHLDGEVVTENTSSGEYAMVTCAK